MRSYQLMVDAIANLGKDMRDLYHIDQMCLCLSYRTMTCLCDTPDCHVLDGGEDFFSEANLTMMLENSFLRYARQDIDLLYLAPSSAIFPLYDKAKRTAESVMEKYPSVRIEVADTGSYGIGQGALAVALAQWRAAGEDLDSALCRLADLKERLLVLSVLDKQPRRGPLGRRKHPQLYLGHLLGVRPVFSFNSLGAVEIQERTNGIGAAIAHAVQLLEDRIGKENGLYFSYVGGEEVISIAQTVLGENAYICQMSPLMQRWFGDGGCNVAGFLPSEKEGADMSSAIEIAL